VSSATLLGAITARFQGNAALATAVPGSPWLDEAPEGTSLPLVAIKDVHEESNALDFEREVDVQSWWTLEVIGEGEAAVEALATQIDALFNWSDTDTAPMTITNRNLKSVLRRRYTVTLDRVRSTEAKRVTLATLTYYAEWEEVIP
jgi:hypothetical protein